MKIKIKDRILAALLAILLLAGATAIVAQTFFGVPVTETVKKIAGTNESPAAKIIPAAIAAVLVLLAVCCLTVLFRHRKRSDRFIRQVTEGGELQIGLEALGNLVDRCLEQHPEITPEKVSLDNDRNSLTVNIAGNVSGGISIPLTVSQLQKQIKQYVTACSGVEVKNVRVTIRNTGEDAKDAPFAIESPVAVPRLRAGAEEEERPSAEPAQPAVTESAPAVTAPETAVPETATAVPVNPSYPPENEVPGMEEPEDDRPLHQRLFSLQEEPCIVPCPPLVNTPEETAGTDTGAEEADTADAAEIALEEAEIATWKGADPDTDLDLKGEETGTDYQEIPEEISEEIPEEISEEIPEEISEEISEEIPVADGEMAQREEEQQSDAEYAETADPEV